MYTQIDGVQYNNFGKGTFNEMHSRCVRTFYAMLRISFSVQSFVRETRAELDGEWNKDLQ